MLTLGRHVNTRYLFPPYQRSEEVVPYVDGLGVGGSNGVLRRLHYILIVLEYRFARHAGIRQHQTPNLPQEQEIFHDICERHVLCIRCRKRGAYMRP